MRSSLVVVSALMGLTVANPILYSSTDEYQLPPTARQIEDEILYPAHAQDLNLRAAATPTPGGSAQGFDISHYQPNVNFASAKSSGAQFVIIKATEGTTIVDQDYQSHLSGAESAGLIHGAYHFAHPNLGTGAAQAQFFLAHGGQWTGDGQTLPGMIDLEAPGGSAAACYGLSPSAMVSWIQDFVNEYQSATGRYPMIYTNVGWWQPCTGNSNAFASTCALNIAHYASAVGTLPGGWGSQTMWQYNAKYQYGGDSDVFNGGSSALSSYASG